MSNDEIRKNIEIQIPKAIALWSFGIRISFVIRHSSFVIHAKTAMSLVAAITPSSTMREVLAAFPGAQRALFRRYHIGGCSSCAFQPDETLRQVCQRNGGLDVIEVLAHIQASHQEDAKILISAPDLAAWLKQDASIRIVDVRSREEFEAGHLENASLLSQEVMRQLMADGTNTLPLVILDQRGSQALDAAAYFLGHGLQNVRCLIGGYEAWKSWKSGVIKDWNDPGPEAENRSSVPNALAQNGSNSKLETRNLKLEPGTPLQARIQEAMQNPQNIGELANADAVGTVGNADCGEMLRMWVKFKEVQGKKVIDQATFQSFGCETAIAVASLATELIRGKTPEEALALKTEELAGELGPLPPMKIHCAQLVEGALRAALEPAQSPDKNEKTVPQKAEAASLVNRFGGDRIE
jgi:nitrogen fixation NifU-like protein